jgi:hypothetical protein
MRTGGGLGWRLVNAFVTGDETGIALETILTY